MHGKVGIPDPMETIMKLRYSMFAALLLTAGIAQAETYVLDPVHTQVTFYINHFGFSNSSGRFLVSKGTLDYDGKDWSKAAVQTTVDVNSLDFGNATWKEHISDPRFLDAKKFPTMEFKSTKVEVIGGNKLKVHGDLTLHGVTKPVVLDTTVNKAAPHPFTKQPAAGFSATTKIKRSEFGVAAYVPNVADEVEIRIEVEASVPKA
jgi:polyisoprenoid-binding protein YceI